MPNVNPFLSAAREALSDPWRNQLLAALPPATWRRWQSLLEPVTLAAGRVLGESGSAPQHLVFPTSAIVSLLTTTRDGAATEFAVVGREGAVGIELVMGGDASAGRAVVQSAGRGYRIGAGALRAELEHDRSLLQLLLGYVQSVIAQVAQTAACNRHHTIDQQLCRRLLLGLDRSESGELAMTQEGAAHLLGVRREGVTAAASRLQQDGVIRYHRGRIAVLDRARLEQRTCECYAATRRGSPQALAARDGVPLAA